MKSVVDRIMNEFIRCDRKRYGFFGIHDQRPPSFFAHHIDGAECETVDRELADLIEKHVHIDLIPTLVRQNVVDLGDPKYSADGSLQCFFGIFIF